MKGSSCRLGRVARVLRQAWTNRIGEADMRDAARPEKAVLAARGAVDELVDRDELAGLDLFDDGLGELLVGAQVMKLYNWEASSPPDLRRNSSVDSSTGVSSSL